MKNMLKFKLGSLIAPCYSKRFSGWNTTLRKTVPFSSPFSKAGNKGVESYKYLKLQDKTVTADEYEKRKKMAKEKKNQIKKAQEELAKHVK